MSVRIRLEAAGPADAREAALRSTGPATTHTTRATIYRSPRCPQMPWSLGVGFDDHLAVLRPGQDAPLGTADAALAAAGLRRVEDWRPHFPQASWGWRTAIVTTDEPRAAALGFDALTTLANERSGR